jgi:hypothetical protein
VQQQAIVTDSTSIIKSLLESVKSDLKKSYKLCSQSVNEVLDNQLPTKERAKIVGLETMTSDINDYSSKLQDQFKQTTESVIIRTGGQISDNIGISQDAIKKRKYASR